MSNNSSFSNLQSNTSNVSQKMTEETKTNQGARSPYLCVISESAENHLPRQALQQKQPKNNFTYATTVA